MQEFGTNGSLACVLCFRFVRKPSIVAVLSE